MRSPGASPAQPRRQARGALYQLSVLPSEPPSAVGASCSLTRHVSASGAAYSPAAALQLLYSPHHQAQVYVLLPREALAAGRAAAELGRGSSSPRVDAASPVGRACGPRGRASSHLGPPLRRPASKAEAGRKEVVYRVGFARPDRPPLLAAAPARLPARHAPWAPHRRVPLRLAPPLGRSLRRRARPPRPLFVPFDGAVAQGARQRAACRRGRTARTRGVRGHFCRRPLLGLVPRLRRRRGCHPPRRSPCGGGRRRPWRRRRGARRGRACVERGGPVDDGARRHRPLHLVADPLSRGAASGARL